MSAVTRPDQETHHKLGDKWIYADKMLMKIVRSLSTCGKNLKILLYHPLNQWYTFNVSLKF